MSNPQVDTAENATSTRAAQMFDDQHQAPQAMMVPGAAAPLRVRMREAASEGVVDILKNPLNSGLKATAIAGIATVSAAIAAVSATAIFTMVSFQRTFVQVGNDVSNATQTVEKTVQGVNQDTEQTRRLIEQIITEKDPEVREEMLRQAGEETRKILGPFVDGLNNPDKDVIGHPNAVGEASKLALD